MGEHLQKSRRMGLPPTFTEGFHTKESIQGITYRQLGQTDLKVSSLSFGASSLGGVFKATDDSESATLVKRVVQQGINYIDVIQVHDVEFCVSLEQVVKFTLPALAQ